MSAAYAKPLLAFGVIGLSATLMAASMSAAPASGSYASLTEPITAVPASMLDEPPEAFVDDGRPLVDAPHGDASLAAPAPPTAPAIPPTAPIVIDAAHVSTCQHEFDRVSAEQRIAFLRDRSDLSPKGMAALDALTIVARACHGMKVEIQGHTDSTGKRAHNIRLSAKRAQAVKAYLVGQGLSPDLLTAVGFGPKQPVATNRTEAGRSSNRRIEFRVSQVE